MKVKYSVHTTLGVVTFKRGDSKAVTISSIKREEDIDAVVDQVMLLLDTYSEVEDEFSKLYDVVVDEKKMSIHRTRTFALKEEVPELFVSGYARECSIKPIIITESEEEKYILEGRPTMRYPTDGRYSRVYACDVGLFPRLRRNRLSNKEMFEFLPCCYATDHLKRPESNYYKYLYNIFDASRGDKKIMRFKPLQPLEEGIIGKIPKALQEMTGSTDLIRVGVKRDKSSILHCTPFYVPRTQLFFPPQICLQELWYLTEEEILANARDDEVFLDPTLYHRALEYIFSADIYVFDVFDDTSIRMSIPPTKGPYIWEQQYDQSIVVLCYRHVLPFPQCELVTGCWNDAIKQFKSQISVCKSALKPRGPIKQKINTDGKCTSVLTKSGWIDCLWRPLDVERVSTDEVSRSALMHRQRLRAYFMCDLYIMCKQWGSVRIEIVKTNFVFTPKIMRETFSTATEFVNYYSSKYPCLFSNGALQISQRTYEKLNRYYNRSPIFPLIATVEEFTRRRNNMITIIRYSENKDTEINPIN